MTLSGAVTRHDLLERSASKLRGSRRVRHLGDCRERAGFLRLHFRYMGANPGLLGPRFGLPLARISVPASVSIRHLVRRCSNP